MQVISVSECFKVHGGMDPPRRMATRGNPGPQIAHVDPVVVPQGEVEMVEAAAAAGGFLAAVAGLAADPFFRGGLAGAVVGGLVMGAFLVYDPTKAIDLNVKFRRAYNKAVNATISGREL